MQIQKIGSTGFLVGLLGLSGFVRRCAEYVQIVVVCFGTAAETKLENTAFDVVQVPIMKMHLP